MRNAEIDIMGKIRVLRTQRYVGTRDTMDALLYLYILSFYLVCCLDLDGRTLTKMQSLQRRMFHVLEENLLKIVLARKMLLTQVDTVLFNSL